MPLVSPRETIFLVPSLRRAGAETQVIDLVNGLDKNIIKPGLVVFERDIAQIGRVNQKFVTFKQFIRKSKFNFLFVKDFGKYIEQQKITVVHCTMQFSLLVTWLALWFCRRKPKLVAAVHTTINVGRKEEILDRLLYRFLFRFCSALIFVCNSQAEHWYKKFPELKSKSLVIYNGVDPNYFDPDQFQESGNNFRKVNNIPLDRKVIVNIAGFRREKGHDFLVDAFAALPNMPHLILAGDGELRGEIEKKVRALGLSDRVHFLGNIGDVRPVLAAADLSVLASTAVETFSMAMLESLSMRVPMVATDIGGLKEAIIPGLTGDLVAIGDSEALTRSIVRVLSDDSVLKNMGNNGRESVQNKFSKQGMIAATQDLIKAI